MSNTDDTTTNAAGKNRIQMRGLCAACGNEQAVMRGVLANHGYRRPWEGWGNVGTCWGAGHSPHEVSPEVAERVREQLRVALKARKERLEALLSGAVVEIVLPDPSMRTFKTLQKGVAPAREWRFYFDSEVSATKRAIAQIETSAVRMEALLTDWAPAPLREVVVEDKAVKRNTLTEEDLLRLTPVRDTGLFRLDRGRGMYALVSADKARVLTQVRGLRAFNYAVKCAVCG